MASSTYQELPSVLPTTPSRADLAALSSEARLDLILALLPGHPSGNSIAVSHLQANSAHTTASASLTPVPDFRGLARSIEPLLDKYRRSKGVPDVYADVIEMELDEGLIEIVKTLNEEEYADGVPTVVFAALTELAELVGKSRNEQVVRRLDYYAGIDLRRRWLGGPGGEDEDEVVDEPVGWWDSGHLHCGAGCRYRK